MALTLDELLNSLLPLSKDIYKDDELIIPQGVEVNIKSRIVTVKGPRGELTKNLRHLNMEIKSVGEDKLKFVVYHGNRKHVACIRTVRSIVNNMITGVTKGFEYKMRYVYAHFPINVIVNDNGKEVEIRNFLGQKVTFRVKMLEGVSVEISSTQKDELIITGNDLDAVSQSAASIQQATRVKNKDIRKFLDGIYVSERNVIETA
ncbi:ribosomal protein L6, alpha-beta domain-containing protein [Umbelopsis sp. PMI_123]|nr:ribosomal protein L6, alpha-beta domain-containing protein [Umbelopsis sp. PMI_123]